jgi:peroxiredoxin Q/BCP
MREFRAHHAEFAALGVTVAGVTRDSPESCRTWERRLRLPYPLLSDPTGDLGRACGVLRHVGLGGWNIEYFRRTTLLVDAHGIVRGVWGQVKIRGHALELLRTARALQTLEPGSHPSG